MGDLPFPPPGEIHAPSTWRRIEFISDLHLSEDLPQTTAALASYLNDTSADAVFVLGDLFEAWVGDDMRHQAYEQRCVNMLRSYGQRGYLGIMVGNRDFLLGQPLLSDCSAHGLTDPTVLHAWGQNALLIHGDELCLSDEAYLRFRAQVRQPAWQTAFLSTSLDMRLGQARQMRAASRAHQTSQTQADWADVDEAAAASWMRSANASILIHGHTHQPQSQPFGFAGGIRHVLSDWDLDNGHPRAEVLRWESDGFKRVSLI